METPQHLVVGDTFTPVIPDAYTVDETVHTSGVIRLLGGHAASGAPVVVKAPLELCPMLGVPGIRREAAVLGHLRSPNIVEVVEFIGKF